MNTNSIISETLILIGAVIMLFAIFKTRKILSRVKKGKFERKWQVLVSLMISFLVGYIAAGYIVYSGEQNLYFVISGIVFFAGALFVYLVVYTSFLTINDLENAVENSARDIESRTKIEKATKEAQDNFKQQNIVLFNLAKSINEKQEDYNKILKQITEIGADILNVERVSVWHFNESKTTITCIDLYSNSKKQHSDGLSVNVKDAPGYFEAIEKNRVIDADDALNDSRTKDLSNAYLKSAGITSMLDSAIWTGGKTRGVICFEHVGPARAWTDEEMVFARTLADMVSLAIETSEKIKAEEKLRKSEERFRKLSESSFEGLAIHNKGKIVEVNASFSKLYGYEKTELIEANILDLVAPESKEKVKNSLEVSVETPLEVIALRKDKTVIYVEIMQRPIEFDGGPCSILSVSDITWKKKTEKEKSDLIEELKKSQETLEAKVQERTADLKKVNEAMLLEMEQRNKTDEQMHIYQDVVKHVPIGLAIFEFENPEDTKSIKVVLGNPAVESYVNIKVKDSAGKYLADISPETFESGRDKIYQEVVKTGQVKDLGTVHYKGNGNIQENFFHTVAFPLPKNCFGLSVENVTENIKIEERFQRIYEGSPAALLMLDKQGNVFEANSQAGELFGYGKEELKKMNYIKLVPERFRKDFIETCNLFFENPEDSEKFKRKEKVILKKDGSEATVEKSLSAIQIKSDVYLLAAVVDVTARKKADEQIRIFKDVVNNMPIGVLMFEFENIEDTKSLKPVMANPAAEKMGSAKINDFIGKPWIEFSPDTFESGRDKIYQEVVKSGQIKDLGVVHYKGTVKSPGAEQIPENYFHFVAFPLSKKSFALSLENVTEQVKTEERFQRVVEASPAALFMVNHDGKITLSNTQAENLFGYSRLEFQNTNIDKLFPAHFQNEFKSYLEKVFNSIEDASGFRSKEGVALKKSGSEAPVDISFSPIYTKTGIFLLISIVDITERKKAEELIQVYEDIVNNLPTGLDIMKFENIEDTKTLKVVTTNPAYNKYSGVKGTDIIGKYAIDFAPDIFKDGQDKIFQEIIKTGKPRDLGTIHHDSNGSPENYIHITAFPIPQNYIAVSYEDITEQIKIEERFRLVVEAAPIAMLMVDKSGRISVVNSQAENLFGYTKEELQSIDFGLLFSERYRKEYLENRQQFFENPTLRAKIQKLKQVILKKDRSELPVEISFVPIYSGNALFMLASIPENTGNSNGQEKTPENKSLIVSSKEEVIEEKRMENKKIEDKILDK